MDAGKLNRWIDIEQRADGHDEAGGPIDVWTLFKGAWSQPKTQSGMSVAANASQEGSLGRSLAVYSFRIRYDDTIDANMRVVYRGRYYNIRRVAHDEELQDWTDLICEVGGADG